ncbi:hypothetical protein RFN62_32830, partial [Rhodococcus erythropolis]
MPIPKTIPPVLRIQIDEAREILSAFIDFHADQTANAIGFRFVPSPDAPTTYPALCTAFSRSVQTKEPLPISNQNSDSVLFTSPKVNIAHRFVCQWPRSSPRRRPVVLPAGGHGFSPVA